MTDFVDMKWNFAPDPMLLQMTNQVSDKCLLEKLLTFIFLILILSYHIAL